MSENFKTPILFLFYNSLETSKVVFEEIKKIRPLYLYIAQDGYREQFPKEKEECLAVRNAVLGMIDWKCNLKTLFREKNLGPGNGTADAIKWFFSQVESGIVLEHDCLPHPDFFQYCESLLNKYKNVEEIKVIDGSNYQNNKKFTNASYYFGASGQLWGWASWKRTFENYTTDITQINFELLKQDIIQTFISPKTQEFWLNTYFRLKEKLIDTWDYQLLYLIWKEKGLIVFPNVNLISNIGFGENAIHCKLPDSKLSNSKVERILPLKHPKKIKRCYKSDANFYDNYLGYKDPAIFTRLKRKIKKYLPS
jgi:hypothetical protein